MRFNRRDFLRSFTTGSTGCYVSSILPPTRLGGAQESGTALCRVLDESGRETAARIRLIDAQGREMVPVGHPEALEEEAREGDVRFQRRRFSYVKGRFQIPYDRLPLRYQVIKGYEYGIAEGELNQANVRDGVVRFPLQRWSSLNRQGWYSGDIHIHHIAPKTCRVEMEAEDLNVANILTSDFTTDQDLFEGKINHYSSGERLIYVNQEFRNHELGHLCLLNLKRLIEPVKPVQPYHHPLHLEVCDQVHAQGGHVSWAHFPSWPGVENPLDVAMEKLDALEILCVLEPREFPIFMKSVVPDAEANDGLRLWYRYLNCGYQLAATAGTDKMTTFVTVGANRVFARVDGPFSYENWISALKAGRTFITNSPLVFLTVNGREPGTVLNIDSKEMKVLEISATADSQLPYNHLEVVCNGEVLAAATPSGDRYHAEIHIEHPITRSCWIAARAYESIEPYRTKSLNFSTVHIEEGTLHGNYYGTRRPETVFAHTSPVYVIRDGQPIRSWDDAQYYIHYMERAMDWMKTEARFANRSDRRASIEAFEQGRAIYVKRAQEARNR